MNYAEKCTMIARGDGRFQFTPGFVRQAALLVTQGGTLLFNPILGQGQAIVGGTFNQRIAESDAFVVTELGFLFAKAASEAALWNAEKVTYANSKVLGTNYDSINAVYNGKMTYTADQNNVIQNAPCDVYKFTPITQAFAGQVTTAAGTDTTSPLVDSKNHMAGFWKPDPVVMIFDGGRKTDIVLSFEGQTMPSTVYCIMIARGYTVTGGKNMTKPLSTDFNPALARLEYERSLYKN